MAWRCSAVVVAGALLCAACSIPISRLPNLPADAVEAEYRLQQIAELREYYTQLARVDAVAFCVRAANREFCENVGAQGGMFVATVQSLPRKYRSYANEALNLSWTHPTVISVVEARRRPMPATRPAIKLSFSTRIPYLRQHVWFRRRLLAVTWRAARSGRAQARWG